MSAALRGHAAGAEPVTFPAGVHTFETQCPRFVSPVFVSQMLPAGHCESVVQGPQRCVVALQTGPADPALVQSVFEQQFPDTHERPLVPEQQTSAVFAAHFVSAVGHVEETHPPVPPEATVLQIFVGPYAGSVWHCVSVVHAPHWLGVVRPQIWPAFAPVQSASTLQLPTTQLPAGSQTYGVVPAP
jgi:hypothetical protein